MPLRRGSLILLAGLALTIAAQPGRGQEGADRLPPGALARFGTLRLRQPYHHSSAVFVAFSPDGKILATRSDDKAVRLWDAASGRQLHRLLHANSPTAFAFSPDSRTLAVATGDTIRRWYTSTGKPLNTWIASSVSSLAFAPDGRVLIAGGSDRSARAWDVVSGKELRVFGENLEPIVEVAVAPDGKTIAAGGQRGTVYLWDADGKELRRLPRDGSRLFGIAFSPDGKRLAVGTRKIIRLWDVADGKEVHQCGTPIDADVTSYNNDAALAFAPDGRFLAAVGKRVQLYDLDTKEFLVRSGPWTAPLPQRASAVAFAPDGKRLAVAGGGQEIRLLDAATGKMQEGGDGHQQRVTCVAVSPDGQTVATGARDHSLFLWDIRTGKSRHPLMGHASALRAVAFSADGKHLASGDAGGMVRVWDVASGKQEHAIHVYPDAVAALALAPDGKWLASGGENGRLGLYDVAREKLLHEFPLQRRGATALTFSADGRLLASADGEGAIRVWRAATGEPEGEPKPPDDDDAGIILIQPIQGPPAPLGRVQLLAFTPGNKRLIFWSRDGAFGLWDIAASQAVRRHDGPAGHDFIAAVSADGRTIALCDTDHCLTLRELATGHERALLVGHGQRSIGAVAFSPDGRRLVSAGGDTTALVWDVTGTLHNQRPAARLTRQQLGGIWSALAGDDGRKAFQGIGALADDPAAALPYLQERLKPVTVEAKQIEKLIAELDGKRFPVREKARTDLEELAELAESSLQKALERKPPLEVRKRLEGLLEKIKRERNALNPHRLRILRAIETLDPIGTPEARHMLETLADAPAELRLTEEVKQEARASLQRLGRQAAAKRR